MPQTNENSIIDPFQFADACLEATTEGKKLKPSRPLWGSWTQKPFLVPHFLLVGNRLHSASMTFPEFRRKDGFKQLLITEGRGCRDKAGAVKKPQLGAGSQFLLKGHTLAISELFCRH